MTGKPMRDRAARAAAAALCLVGCRAAGGEKKPPEKIEFPPIEKLPEIKELPDPFTMISGKRVKTREDWRKRREEIKAMLLHYQYGRMPPPPGNVTAEETSSQPAFGGTYKRVRLSMGPDKKLKQSLRVSIPNGKGPFPAIVRHYASGISSIPGDILREAVRRGYLVAEFNSEDLRSRDAAGPAQVAYPDYDWATVAVWGWGAMRVIDYLHTLDQVDKKKIAVTGHSRGGKMALLTGAFDERVALTVPNGSGCGGADCYRVKEKGDVKRILWYMTGAKRNPHWFHPRLTQFALKRGIVDTRLPYDAHFLGALIAPRALLSTDALADKGGQVSPLGTQQTYMAAKVVYDWLGAPDRIGIHFREGGHRHSAEDWAALLDYADLVFFGKKPKSGRKFDKLPRPEAKPYFSWRAPPKPQ